MKPRKVDAERSARGLPMNRHRFLIILLMLSSVSVPAADGTVYRDDKLTSIRVPVGGVGTGNILMGGRGNIQHLEIFNRPDRQRVLEKTHFALWVQKGERKPVAKLLERELFPPFRESTHKTVGGLPRMRQAEFIDRFPLYTWNFNDPDVPLKSSLEVFSPFVPLDLDRSSYPAIAFYWDFENTATEPVRGSIVLNMENPIKGEKITNRYVNSRNVKGIHFLAEEAGHINYRGGLMICTTMTDVDIQTHWHPGEWRDETHIFWDDFSADGSIKHALSEWQTRYFSTSYNLTTQRMASVLVHFELQPGESIRIPYYLTWHFPERKFELGEVFGQREAAAKTFHNYYSRLFESEWDVLQAFIENEAALYGLTTRFSKALFSSSFDPSVKEALVTQAATLRSPLIQVTADGTVHGFEGVLDDGWCCPGTCAHVWNYEQTLASLFPFLERKMREIEFLHNTFDNGFLAFRSLIPLGDYWFDGPAAADGQMGSIVRAYREWKLSGDDQWLLGIWPKVRKALEFAWHGPGKTSDPRFEYQERQTPWDADKSGILSGTQHNTYDINFVGPNSMTTSIYLAALKAGSEMAAAMGDEARAAEYLDVYHRGAGTARELLWNGSYFVQILEDGATRKYQYGDGCLSDQLLGQYLAFNAGLGYVVDATMARQSIKAVFDHNFIDPLRSFANVQRVYGLNDEAGVVLCTWPHGRRPALPFVYCDEIWTGVEYQVAASLIYLGFVDEGVRVVKAVQDRYDGYKRNPYEQDESGVHYARAMASWSLLLALSGIEYDGRTRSLSFDPKVDAQQFHTFWSTGSAWGQLKIDSTTVCLSVEYGELELVEFGVRGKISRRYDGGKRLAEGDSLVFDL